MTKKFTREQLMRELLRRTKEQPHQVYIPTGKGEEFVNTVFEGKYFITLFSAANGIGKSTVGFNMLAHLMFPCGNKFFQQKLMAEWPYLKRVRIVSDPTNITKNIVPELKKWLPKGRYTAKKEGRAFECLWTTDTGWTIDIMSTEQDPKEFESVNLGLIWIDEPCPENIYKACVSRLRMGGKMFITATPLTGSAWMYDKIINSEDAEAGKRTFIEASVWSACKGHPEAIRGFLNKENIETMIAQYDDEDMQARVLGKFQHLTGMVFKKWNRRVHVIPPFEMKPEDYSVWQMLDPHPRTEDAALWCATDRHGRHFVVDELWVNGTTSDVSYRILEKDARHRVVKHIADPWIFTADQHTQYSMADRFRTFGLNYIEATKQREASDRRIAEALDYAKVGEEFLKHPDVYVFDTCKRTIYEMEHYRWDDWTGKSADKRGAKQKPLDKDDHMIENLGRFLIQEPRFEPMPNYAQDLPLDNMRREDMTFAGQDNSPLGSDPFA